jgi:hypothetical protein
MKRLTLLAAALVMVLGFAVSASAAPEVTVSGNILINAVWGANWDFNDDDASTVNEEDKAMWIRERIDLGFTAVANENLKAVIVLRSVRGDLGQGDLQAAQGAADGGGGGTVIFGLNQGYMDFNWPGTSVNVKAGWMPVALPAAVGGGSMILDDIATGVLVSTALNDNVSLLGGWVRVADANDYDVTAGGSTSKTQSEIDAWILAMPLSFEGVSAAPFIVYAPLGEDAIQSVLGASGSTAITGLRPYNSIATDEVNDAWWIGSSLEVSILDPFIIKGDLNYGTVNGDDDDADRSGWLFDIALEYTGFDFMNLELAYAYTSGKDGDASGDDDRMPVIADTWALGSFWFGAGLITGDDMGSTNANMGFHAVALSATGIQSFAEGLTHDAHIVWATGTNEDGGTANSTRGLTYGRSLMDGDDMLEIDFNTFYKIYDELTLYNGIGYINLDASDDASDWGAGNDGGDAWKFQLGLKYVF